MSHNCYVVVHRVHDYLQEEMISMIEFDGHITGAAEKHFQKKAGDFVQKTLIVGMVVASPIIILFSQKMQSWLPMAAYGLFFVCILLTLRIPKSKKERTAVMPKRVYTEEEFIVCVADTYEEYRNMGDVKEVRDYGDFYELVFPFGKVSDKFICQKDLLTKGTIEEFESLFEGKIVRKV